DLAASSCGPCPLPPGGRCGCCEIGCPRPLAPRVGLAPFAPSPSALPCVPSPGRCHPCCLTRTDRRHSILGPSRGSVDTAPAAALSPRRTRLLPEAATGSSHPRRRRVEALSQARIAREYLALSWITC